MASLLPGDLISVRAAWRAGPYKGHPGTFVTDGCEGIYVVTALTPSGSDVYVTPVRGDELVWTQVDLLDRDEAVPTPRVTVLAQGPLEIAFLGCVLPFFSRLAR